MIYPQPPTLLGTSAALLVLFLAIASADGLYLHLYRYRLYRRPASRHEHRLHTVNALLFPPLTFLLYCVQPAGALLWLAAALFAATVAVEIADVRCEYDSRADLGGLTRDEYLMHFLMSGLRAGAVVPLLASAPGPAWALGATALGPRPLWLALLGYSIAAPGVVLGLVHLALCRAPRAAREQAPLEAAPERRTERGPGR